MLRDTDARIEVVVQQESFSKVIFRGPVPTSGDLQEHGFIEREIRCADRTSASVGRKYSQRRRHLSSSASVKVFLGSFQIVSIESSAIPGKRLFEFFSFLEKCSLVTQLCHEYSYSSI
jgi:hypothetical protein